eukprot:758573-Hanusia_phi.AAC.9
MRTSPSSNAPAALHLLCLAQVLTESRYFFGIRSLKGFDLLFSSLRALTFLVHSAAEDRQIQLNGSSQALPAVASSSACQALLSLAHTVPVLDEAAT